MVLAPSGAEVSLDILADVTDRVIEVAAPSVAAVGVSQTLSATAKVDSILTEDRHLLQLVSISMPASSDYAFPCLFSDAPSAQPDHHNWKTPSVGTISNLERLLPCAVKLTTRVLNDHSRR